MITKARLRKFFFQEKTDEQIISDLISYAGGVLAGGTAMYIHMRGREKRNDWMAVWVHGDPNDEETEKFLGEMHRLDLTVVKRNGNYFTVPLDMTKEQLQEAGF